MPYFLATMWKECLTENLTAVPVLGRMHGAVPCSSFLFMALFLSDSTCVRELVCSENTGNRSVCDTVTVFAEKLGTL